MKDKIERKCYNDPNYRIIASDGAYCRLEDDEAELLFFQDDNEREWLDDGRIEIKALTKVFLFDIRMPMERFKIFCGIINDQLQEWENKQKATTNSNEKEK